MPPLPLLDELAVVATLGVAVTVLLSKLKLPTVAGLLAAGALVGPYGLQLTRSVHAIEALAEVGVVFLLFSIGLEFSLSRLQDIFRRVALGGALQVGLTTLATIGVASWLGEPLGRGVFWGFTFALSSTAIVLRALSERRELDAPHGRFIVGALIFQDLCVVPMVLIVPLLGSDASPGEIGTAIAMALGKAGLVVTGTVAVSRFIVPRVLDWVDASRSREAFLLAILGLCIGTAWLTSLAGLSLALGAFLGGMVVADTQYGHRAMGDMLPLRDAFVSIFFVSLGMLFDPAIVLTKPWLIGGLLLGLLLAKGLLATLTAMVMRFPARVAWLAGVGLAQFGEFGFVLTRLAQSTGLVSDSDVRPLMAAGILSMFLTPLLVRAAPHVTAGERLLAPLERVLGVRAIDQATAHEVPLRDHILIIGFGLAGQYVARALKTCDVPFVVLELNAANVHRGKSQGLPVYYGDATSPEALEHAHLSRARLAVVLMNDPRGALRVADTIRRVAPAVAILMRTHYWSEALQLLRHSQCDVVSEEVEGAVEVVARVLRSVETPRNVIEAELANIRIETQPSSQRKTVPRPRLGSMRGLDDLKIESLLVRSGSRASGQSAISLNLRSTTGALVVGVRRAEHLLETSHGELRFEEGDIVYLVGTGESLTRAIPHFSAPEIEPL